MKTSEGTQPVSNTAGFFGELVDAAIQAAGAITRRASARFRQHRQAQNVLKLLRQLDDRELRDIGLHRSEIRSVAAEIAGKAERTRRHACPACCCEDDRPAK